MKPFLGIDLTEDKNNEQWNGEAFLTVKPSEALVKSLVTSTEQAEQTIERSKLPLPLRIIQGICGFAAMIVIIGILRADVSIAEGYRNAPVLFWVGGVSAVIWLILWGLGKLKAKSVLGTEESSWSLDNLERISNAVYTELGVPADTREVDVLSFFYKIKDGELKVCEKGMQTAKYLNPVFKALSDDENLYLANLEGKYAIPRSSITALRTVKKHIVVGSWNKETEYNKGVYKKYKLTADNYGRIHCKYYHILEFRANDELWGIYIPCYELPVFERLTGMKAEEK